MSNLIELFRLSEDHGKLAGGGAISLPQTHEWIADAIFNPDFDEPHWSGWQRYVPDVLEKCWFDLSLETRLIVICMADQRAQEAREMAE